MKKLVFILALLCAAPALAASAPSLEMWDLQDLYASDAAWTKEEAALKTEIARLDTGREKLGSSAADMLSILSRISDVQKRSDRLAVYASLKADEDVRIAANQERQQLAQALRTSLSEKTAWLTPAILKLGPARVRSFIKQSAELKRRFGFYLENVLRGAPHILGAEAEGVLAAVGQVLAQPENVYGQLANGDLPFPTVTLSSGEKVKLDQSAYEKYRQSTNRADRKKVFDAFWGAWKKYEGTFGASLNNEILGEQFNARTRHYKTALAAALFEDNMPESVYRRLVAEANAGLPVFHRYLRLRKRLLGINDALGYHDMYPPMFKDTGRHYSIADAKRLTLEAVKPYGGEYTALLQKGFSGRWMDAGPRQGKASGAYMSGSAYDVHPYLLLNHNSDYDSLSTFAHEWGHAVHTMLAKSAQPYDTAGYSTFIAETASIANEMLLADRMAASAKTKAEKLFFLGAELELIRTTFFRQTMFGEFQLALHEEIEKGRALSGKRMTELYCKLLKKYHGEAAGVTKIDPAYCIEWAFIPHFYYGFYVYQYATSLAGAAEFSNAIEKGDKGARDRYIAMLKAGGSDYPYVLYKRAGLDMASPAPYRALVARMGRLLDEIETLTK